jgi:hypothetical protein
MDASSLYTNNIFFQEFKPYVSQYQYEKSSLLANIFCVVIVLIFIYYFFYKISSSSKLYRINNRKFNS